LRESPTILLRAWHRFVAAEFWCHVERSNPLVVHARNPEFRLEAFYDPGPVHDDSPPTVVFRVYVRDRPPATVYEFLHAQQALGELTASTDGLGGLPPVYTQYLRAKALQISRLSTDAYELLLWRHKVLDGPPSLAIDPTRFFWAEVPPGVSSVAVQNLAWNQVPSGIRLLELPPGEPLDLRPEAGERLAQLLETRTQAPLGHVLLREALRLHRDSNLRGALVIGVAAVETGTKEFICQVAPDTSWLVEHLQSPPLDRLLRDYVPTLPSKASGQTMVSSIPQAWRRALARAVETRNKIVHGRQAHLDDGEIHETLSFALQLLYLLDYHLGCDWARPAASP